MDTAKLRLNGFSADQHGHDLLARGERWNHERTENILQINVSKDTARSLVGATVLAINEPRCLVGCTSNGSAVLLFRVDPRSSTNNKHVSYELPSGEGIEIIFGSENLTVAVDKFTWEKGRSPLEISRDALPPLRDEHLKSCRAYRVRNGRPPSVRRFERQRESERRVEVMRQRLANGETPESMEADRQHEEDLKLVERYAGQEPGQFDEMRAEIRAARYRICSSVPLNPLWRPRLHNMLAIREQMARARSRVRGGRVRAAAVAVAPTADDTPPSAFADKEILHRDPGTWIAPSRVSDFIDRVFA